LLIVVSHSLPSSKAQAQLPIVPFGARSVALGGAGVALSSGAGAVLDNPAAIGTGRLGVWVSAGGLAVENGDVLDPLRVVTGNDPFALAAGAANAGDVRNALKTLADPGNGLTGQGLAALAVSYQGWGISLGEVAFAGAFVRADLVHVAAGLDPATSFSRNTSFVAFRGLEIQQAGLSRSLSFFGDRLFVGGSVSALRGTAHMKDESVFTTEVDGLSSLVRRGITGTEQTATKVSFDAGVLVAIGVLRVGGVAKGLNEPTFDVGGRQLSVGRQVRVGASVHVPLTGLVVAADYDLTKSETLVDGLQRRMVGGGIEWTLALLAVRAGLSVDLESPGKTRLFSAGVGFGLGPIHVDAAGVYKPNESAIGASLSARVKL
jgi:hypothetical protein